MSKVAVCGVLHPGNLIYFADFINNLNLQTYQCFDLIIINEGVDINSLNVNFQKGELFNENSKDNDAKKNRDQMFDFLRRNTYDVNILADLDDLMSNDRVEKSVFSILENKSDICFNDLVPFVDPQKISIKNKYWSDKIDFEKQTPNINHNVFGLGNTAISKKITSLNIKVNNNLVYDWEYFLKVYSLSNYKISKSNGYTFYRQSNNTLGVNNRTKEKLLSLIEIKIIVLNEVIAEYPLVKNEIIKTNKLINKQITNQKLINYYWFEN